MLLLLVIEELLTFSLLIFSWALLRRRKDRILLG